MLTVIQPTTQLLEIELTDEQLASISGGIGHEREQHDHDRGRWGDDDDRRGWGNHWHPRRQWHRGHWFWDPRDQQWEWSQGGWW